VLEGCRGEKLKVFEGAESSKGQGELDPLMRIIVMLVQEWGERGRSKENGVGWYPKLFSACNYGI